MADRIFGWFVEEPKGNGTSEGMIFLLEKSYVLPGKVRIFTDKAPDGNNLEIDIQYKTNISDNWVSIFSTLPTLIQHVEKLDDTWDDFDDSLTLIDQFSWVRLTIPQTGGAKRISVSLELNEHHEEEEVQDED